MLGVEVVFKAISVSEQLPGGQRNRRIYSVILHTVCVKIVIRSFTDFETLKTLKYFS